MKTANESLDDSFKPMNTGRSPDLYLTGILLYGSIVVISNFKLL
jgi:hypothetical protein